MEESVEALGQRGGLAALGLDGAQVGLVERRGVRVEAEENLLVAERVLLLDRTTLGLGLALGGADDALDFGAVDETSKIGLGDDGGGDGEAALALVDGIEGLEGGRGPDDETSEVTTRGELEEVEGVDGRGLDAGDVAEARDQSLAIDLRVVDDERSAALAVAAATELTLTGTELPGVLDALEIGTGTDGLQEAESRSGLGAGLESLGLNDEGNLGDLGDLVAAGEDEGSDRGGSEGRGNSETPIVRTLEISHFPNPSLAGRLPARG